MAMRFERGSVQVMTRGHYRIRLPEEGGPFPLLLGFHGYAQNADEHLASLGEIPGTERWAVAAAQGLHHFYRRADRVVGASWMTRFGRENAIADNVAYISELVLALRERFAVAAPLVFAGFSQGVAMAYRAAAGSGHECAGLVALGGDVPPEIEDEGLACIGRILLGRGRQDELYTGPKMAEDRERLEAAGVDLEVVEFDGGHEWHPEFLERCGSFLADLESRAGGVPGALPRPPAVPGLGLG